jgi:hypothetical protein
MYISIFLKADAAISQPISDMSVNVEAWRASSQILAVGKGGVLEYCIE